VAICLVVDNAEEGQEAFESVMKHLGQTGPVPPTGARLLAAGPAEGGWRVISIWDSPESLQRFFGERLAPAYQDAGLSLDGAKRSTFEVHTLVVADGGAQGA
jgi:hypothetical protein